MGIDFRAALNDPNDELNNFDNATGDGDLANFDNATGETHVPAGWYTCTIPRGTLTTTRTDGKMAYRLTFDVVDGPHRGFRVWRTYTFATQAAANWAKSALAPLGLRTGADLRKPFPAAGRVVTAKVLVTLRDDPRWGKRNDVERFEVVDDRQGPPNPNAVDLDQFAKGEGGPK